MKLSAVVEYDENMAMTPLVWMTRENRQFFIQMEYEVIPIPGYKETNGYRAFKIIGKYNGDLWQIRNLSIPIWEDWKLTAKYAADIEIDNSTNGQQMFDHLDDDEKIKALTYIWYDAAYIKKYFRKHPELLERARHSLNMDDIHCHFKELYDN